MLTTETKRKIDSARDILVGKVPDPKAQVEQITTALIYKFMDDMDKEAQELGGKARFFTNGYEKYAWTKMMDSRIGGQERLNLYVEAITTLSQNPHLPQLFRDIFKDAFLPYRDPETLSLFLKQINGFNYEHSENLGDAFEYLLSVLGSQGDAGQFRTPRHIIDFIVSIVDPRKDEAVLDPACGTAGFLVSTYKHILKQNRNKPLTPDEKKKLMENLVGYDISPDMVRLSRVNMYLHGFPEPKIYEYDTLTSESKWDESFDVTMANPPFMTPRGGIRPHKRFAIQANRAEVLFVDYIIEHIRQYGKAGIIVPDGIVSNKNSSAYISLRKKLIDDGYLYAVVSLHPGVFKPYADVKTSILLINRKISRESKMVAFFEVENDGFEKGNRKRAIAEDDLPQAIELIKKFQNVAHDKEQVESLLKHSSKLFVVDKKTIAEDGFYILRSNKYKASIKAKGDLPSERLKNHIFELSEINNLQSTDPLVFSVSNEKGLVNSRDYFDAVVQSGDLSKYKVVPPGSFVFNPARANVGSLALNDTDKTGLVSPMYTIFRIKEESDLVPEYLFHLLKSEFGVEQIRRISSGAVRQTLKFNGLEEMEIPIPPMSFQNSFRKAHYLIQHLSLAINNYEPYLKIDPNWKEAKLVDYFKLVKGGQPIEKATPGQYQLVTTGDSFATTDRYQFDGEAICVPLISSAGHGKASLNRIYFVKGKFSVGNILMAMLPKSKFVNTKFYYYLFSQEKDNLFTNLMYGTSNVSFKIADCSDVTIPLPSIDVQNKILDQIETEKSQIDRNMDLINLFKKKIEEKVNEIWGK